MTIVKDVNMESMSKGEVWRVETTEPNDGTNKPPYRDNTLLEELEKAKKEASSWKEKHDEAWAKYHLMDARHEAKIQRVREEAKNSMRSWVRFLLWGVFTPAVGLLALFMFVFPFVAVIQYHLPPEWFWLTAPATIIMIFLLMYLDDNAK